MNGIPVDLFVIQVAIPRVYGVPKGIKITLPGIRISLRIFNTGCESQQKGQQEFKLFLHDRYHSELIKRAGAPFLLPPNITRSHVAPISKLEMFRLKTMLLAAYLRFSECS